MRKKRILIVEDERIVADDIKMSLEKLGYDACGIVSSGESAIKKAGNLHPDLILMDIVLEGEMDGIDASAAIHSQFKIPVVYLTAYTDKKTLERAKITEPFGYIIKPFQDRDLHTTIETALYKYEMENKLKESEEKYRSLAENAHDAIYISTSKGFQYVNPAFERLTGWKKKELCTKDFNFWDIVHPDDTKLLMEREKAKQRGEDVPHFAEFKIISKDKGIKIIEANTVIIKNNGGLKEIGILRDITKRRRAEEELKKSIEKLQKTFEETINALVSALEIRDPYTAGHQRRVAHLASAIAQELDFPKDNITGLKLASLVHDVGKIQIPSEILIKPSHLSETEFNMIEMHPEVGHNILQSIEFPYPVAKIVYQHHERLNGSGYPEGIHGEKILPEAKILAVADVVEAMSSHRPYRPALGINSTLKEINKNKNILYDPDVVSACTRLFQTKRFSFEKL